MKALVRRYLPHLIAGAAILLAAAVVRTDAFLIMGIAFALFAFGLAWHDTERLRRGLGWWVRELPGPLILVGIAVSIYWRLLLGDMPINHDHPVFLLRAWITGSELFSSGRLAGYSDTQFAGYPANVFYPIGVDLLVCLVKGLTLNIASWETAYCWALFLAILAYPLGIYAIAHRIGGPVAGVLAGTFGLLDRGGYLVGGWSFDLDWGVWSMGLGFSLCLWSLWSLERLARRPGRPGWVVLSSCLFAGAILCHPMSLAILAITVPLLLLALASGHGELPAGAEVPIGQKTGDGGSAELPVSAEVPIGQKTGDGGSAELPVSTEVHLGQETRDAGSVELPAGAEVHLGQETRDAESVELPAGAEVRLGQDSAGSPRHSAPGMIRRLGHHLDWLPRTLVAPILGGALAAFWLLPFMGHKDWYLPLAASFDSYQNLLHGIVEGDLLTSVPPLVAIAGCIGLVLAAWSRRSMGFFLLLSFAFLLFFCSDTFLIAFDALAKFPMLANLQTARFVYPMRAFVLVGAGYLFYRLLAGPHGSAEAMPRWKWEARLVLLALVIAPVLLFRVGLNAYTLPLKTPLVYASKGEQWQDLMEAAAFLNNQERGSVGRIALVDEQHGHLLVALPVFTGLDIFKVGFTPENNFRYKLGSEDREVWRALNISHVLSSRSLRDPDLVEQAHFGYLWLYRYTDFSEEVAHLDGPGDVTAERLDSESMDFRISGIQSDTRLVVHRARFALWTAEFDGRPLAIDPVGLGDSPDLFMAVTVDRDGLLTLRYRRGGLEWGGLAISILSLGLMALLLLWRPIFKKSALSFFGPRTRLATVMVILVGAGIVALAFVIRLLSPPPSMFPGESVVTNLSDRLPRASAELIRDSGRQDCEPYDDRRIQCPAADWNTVHEVITTVDAVMRQCIWAHPVESAQLTVHFPDVEMGESLRGHYGIYDGAVGNPPQSNRTVTMTVFIDGTEAGAFECPDAVGWHEWSVPTPDMTGTRATVTVRTQARDTGRRHFCFTGATTVPEE